MTRPLVVVEASERAFGTAVAEVERDGARIVRGWRNEDGVVCAAAVRDAEDAAHAILAAVAGAGVIAHAQAERDVVDRLVDDLRRFGQVDHRVGEPESPAPLTADERAVLAGLAEGKTLGATARELHLSRRTADRRLASARTKLGVGTTAEAVAAYVRAR